MVDLSSQLPSRTRPLPAATASDLPSSEVVQFTTLWSTTIYITLPLGESSLSEERAMRVACIPSMALRIALSGRYRVRLSQRESE